MRPGQRNIMCDRERELYKYDTCEAEVKYCEAEAETEDKH